MASASGACAAMQWPHQLAPNSSSTAPGMASTSARGGASGM
jgi:hypothetical protein